MSTSDGLLEQQAAQVRRGTQAGIGQVDLALVGVDPLAQFGVVAGRQAGLADQGHRHVVDHAEVLEVVQRLVGQVAVQRRRGGHADVVQQEGVAVGGRLGHLGRTQRAAGTAHVLDDDGLVAQTLAQHFGQVACHLVGGAAGGEGHDDGDGLLGVGGQCGQGGQGGQCEGELLHRCLRRLGARKGAPRRPRW
jgi:hypothetical protein